MEQLRTHTLLRLAGVFSLGALMMLSMACKNGGSGSASLPAISLASTIDQGAAADESSGMQSLRMASPGAGQVPVVSLVDAVKEKLGAKATPCAPGEGRGCLDAAPITNGANGASTAKEPRREVHGQPVSDPSSNVKR